SPHWILALYWLIIDMREFLRVRSVMKYSLNAPSTITLGCLLGSLVFSARSLEALYVTVAEF
ncbi:MAG: hypothetical protein ABGZ08_05195, partial [Akkermansiaceae bacterium]